MTVRNTIIEAQSKLTASERKLANAIFADYPFTGLQTIQELARHTGVSAPSVTRFVSKIGYGGYQDFQRQLIGELRESRRSPLDLKVDARPADGQSFLAEYVGRMGAVIGEMSASLPQNQFDTICGLVADPSRNVFLLGGRISDSIASFLAIHLRQIRGRVEHLPAAPEQWPDQILRMRKQDVVILFDFRRYQPDIARLAGIIRERRRPSIILITDKWMSPVARDSDLVVALPIAAGTAWDTVVCAIAFVEALIVRVSEADWPATRDRIEAWDAVRISLSGTANVDGDQDEA